MFHNEYFPLLEQHHKFPLRKNAKICIQELLCFGPFELHKGEVKLVEITREIASPAELSAYVSVLIS